MADWNPRLLQTNFFTPLPFDQDLLKKHAISGLALEQALQSTDKSGKMSPTDWHSSIAKRRQAVWALSSIEGAWNL